MTHQEPAGGLELHELDVPDAGLLPFAVGTFDSIGPLSRAPFPHRHTFYELAYVCRGSGVHSVDLVDHRIDPPNLFVIAPGEVHHWARATSVAGWVLLFNEDFLLRHPSDLGLVRALAAARTVRPAPDQHRALTRLMADLDEEYQTPRPGRAGVLQALLHILLTRALRAARGPGTDGPGAPAGGGRPLAERFGRLISEPDRRDRSVASLARELGVSAGRLHEIVKEATGVTPARLIRRQQTLEAKRLLAGTDLTVRQIAAATGFGDPAYFCRFFRREVGRTPGEFRGLAGSRAGASFEGQADAPVDGPAGDPAGREKHHDAGAESIDRPSPTA